MVRAPAFWRTDSIPARLLSPLSAIVTAVTRRRTSWPGWRAPVPVICCGNVTVGGAGKTTVVLDLAVRLLARGVGVQMLLRGYGGRVRGPHRVQHGDTAAEVGDEALLLAAVAPTWVGADRAASARAAVAAGAEVLLMDDGLQNHTLAKDLSLLVVDGATGFGNGRVLPAGPLREPVADGLERSGAVVLIGPDTAGVTRQLRDRPVLHARLEPQPIVGRLRGQRILPFAGIAHPSKFFDPLSASGCVLVATASFPDHHPYSDSDLARLLAQATELDAQLVTTPKDAVRLPAAFRDGVTVVGVALAWEDPGALDRLLADLHPGPAKA